MKGFWTRNHRAGAGAALGAALLATVLATSAGSGLAAARVAPINDSAPTIAGTAREGETLTGSPGSWRGTQPLRFDGQWRRCNASGSSCSSISGANDPIYRLTSADVGRTIRLRVTASNRDGRTTATSAATGVVAAAPLNAPLNTSAPSIAGTAQDGQTLTGNTGAWQGTPRIDFDLRWQRCDAGGANCANVSGATRTTYRLVSADVGNTVRLRVTATNRAGTTNAYSRQSAVVAAKGPSLPPGAIRLPDGKVSIPASSVSRPELLLIGTLDFQPNPLRVRTDPITARFRIFDTRGYVVRDALVLVTPLPYGWTTQPAETVSAQDGWATVTMRATQALPRKAAIVMFVRARKSGDFVLTGVSTRRLVQMLVDIAA